MPLRIEKTWIETSRRALRANVATLRAAIGKKVRLLAVVKAEAYGHGITATVQGLRGSGINWIGVDSLAEAEEARRADPKTPILILGYTPFDGLALAMKRGYSLTVSSDETIRRLGKVATKKRPAKIHLKLETGTNRQGILEERLAPFLGLVKRTPNVIIEGGSTHFANTEDANDPSYAMLQLARFRKAVATIESTGARPALCHTAASAAILLHADTHFAMVRAGISLYGLWPSEEVRKAVEAGRGDISLRPALTWKALVAQVKTLPAGSPIGYDLTEHLKRESRIAVIPVGYADGLDRKLSSKGHVLIRGKRARIVGRVCMNMCMVDVTDIPDAKLEDEAVILGRQRNEEITAEEIAATVGTINYEIVARINPRIRRVLVA